MRRVALLPVYNEETTVIHVLNSLLGQIDLFVLGNDGSTDSTGDLLGRWAAGRKNVHFLSWERQRGMSYALKRGFIVVRSLLREGKISPEDLVLTIDADGQHESAYIPALIHYLVRNGLDMVIARRDFEGYPRYRIWGNKLLSWNATLLGGMRFRDAECGFRVMKAGAVPGLFSYYTGCRYSCAQEIAVICAGLGLRMSNDFLIKIPYYRSNTQLRDALINVALGIVAFLRVKLGFRSRK